VVLVRKAEELRLDRETVIGRRLANADFVVGRVRNLEASNPRSAVDDALERLQHVRICAVLIGVGALLPFPKGDSNGYGSARTNECNLVGEAALLPEQGMTAPSTE
jgi:hypothetical protein